MFPLGAVASLFGGGGAQSDTGGATAGPVTQTTGPVSFGSKYLGRGSVTSAGDTSAAGGSSIVQSPNSTPLYVAAGVGVLLVALLLISRKG